jgi:F-type H+-transporting ATPase subunit gamma
MPESLKVLRRRIRSVKSTKQVTRAMEMVSASKLRRAQAALMAARPYVGNLQKLLGRLAPQAEASGDPLFAKRKVRRATYVLCTGDRGLCGSYNANLIRIAENHMRDRALGAADLFCIGRRGADYFSRRRWPVIASYGDLGGVLDRENTDEIADRLRDLFLSGKTDEVHLIYPTFISTALSKPRCEKFLDLDLSSLVRNAGPDDREELVDYIFEPSRKRVFDKLVPEFLYAKIYIMLAEAFTSEHAARMLAMNNASRNCDELVDTLTLNMNKARQSAITADLLDIVGGAEAIQAG